MSEYIKVNTTKLKTDAESVMQCIKNMKTEIKHMKSSKKTLDGMWDGPSSEAFKKAFDVDMKLVADVLDMLEEIQNYEVNARKKYDDCEKKVNALVDSIKV